MWVGVEVATLATVMMVGTYRTPEAIEAAWKYFILGSVGIGLAFFGTVLTYLVAAKALGGGLSAMAWDLMVQNASRLDSIPSLARIRFSTGRLRHQSRARAVPRLAAWRAFRGADAVRLTTDCVGVFDCVGVGKRTSHFKFNIAAGFALLALVVLVILLVLATRRPLLPGIAQRRLVFLIGGLLDRLGVDLRSVSETNFAAVGGVTSHLHVAVAKPH